MPHCIRNTLTNAVSKLAMREWVLWTISLLLLLIIFIIIMVKKILEDANRVLWQIWSLSSVMMLWTTFIKSPMTTKNAHEWETEVNRQAEEKSASWWWVGCFTVSINSHTFYLSVLMFGLHTKSWQAWWKMTSLWHSFLWQPHWCLRNVIDNLTFFFFVRRTQINERALF